MPNDLPAEREIGRLQGAVEALQTRMDRHEITTHTKLDGIYVKLEAISAQLAASGGARNGVRSIVHYVISVVAAIGAFLGGAHYRSP